MSRLHICNTFFEKELEMGGERPLEEWLRSHPIILQLQFMPLLYAAKEDVIAVSDLPVKPDPRLCLLSEAPKGLPIEHWGPSRAIQAWAKERGLEYEIPDWARIQKINSKIFSFSESPKLPGAKILSSKEELEEWMQKTAGPKVLKTPFGTAGKGHRLIDGSSPVKFKGPVIAEPWVERVLDFSTQWKNKKLIGVTVFENEANGTYRRTINREVEKWALDEHLKVASALIEKIGYLDHIGIDAFIYLCHGEKCVHPVVEINARKTMSWVALQTPNQCLSYTQSETGALPSSLRDIHFPRNIFFG